jgi:hypothetical protein
MKHDRFLRASSAVIIGTIVLAGCHEAADRGITHPNPPLGYVRFFNAVSDTLPLDLVPIDQVEYSQSFRNVPFRGIGLGNYTGWSTGDRHVRVFPYSQDLATTTTVLADVAQNIAAGAYYSFIETGYARPGSPVPLSLWIIQDSIQQPSTNIAFRVVDVGADLGRVDIYITASADDSLPARPAVANIGFKEKSAYIQRAPGPLVMRVFAAGTRTPELITRTAPVGALAAAGSGLTHIGGAGLAGSVLTAMVYSKAVLGSPASVTGGQTPNTTPTVVFWVDLAPPGKG